jgi:hypothetical protein
MWSKPKIEMLQTSLKAVQMMSGIKMFIRPWRKSAFTVSEASLSCFGPMIDEYLGLDLENNKTKNTGSSLIHRSTI